MTDTDYVQTLDFTVEVFDTITQEQYDKLVGTPQPTHWAWRNSPEYWNPDKNAQLRKGYRWQKSK